MINRGERMIKNKKIIIGSLIIIGIVVVSFSLSQVFKPKILNAQETVNVFLEAGITEQPDLAKGATIENDVKQFATGIIQEKEWIISNWWNAEPEVNLTDEELKDILEAITPWKNKTKFHTECTYQDDEKAVILVTYEVLDTKFIYTEYKKILKNNKNVIGLANNRDKKKYIKLATPYVIDAYKTVLKSDVPVQKNKFPVVCRFNKKDSKWEIEELSKLKGGISLQNGTYTVKFIDILK